VKPPRPELPPGTTIDRRLARTLYRRARATRWHVHEATFIVAVERAVAKAFAGGCDDLRKVERFCESLHLEDLALACACETGNDEAWQHFVRTYRPVLYRAADAIDPTGDARELADALYGDLYGTRERDNSRQSLFRYFHGRSSLSTWLRSVLAQRHIDRIRQRRSTEPLSDDEAASPVLRANPPPDPERPRLLAAMHAVFAAAVAGLSPRDRFRLGCYYAQQMRLAQIGRLTGEHEATVSRQLSRTRTTIRETAERLLRNQHGLAPAQIDECFALIAEDPGTLDLAALLNSGKEPALERSQKGTET
jgi:RNA polymerase sigma factor (sigma-70 family)